MPQNTADEPKYALEPQEPVAPIVVQHPLAANGIVNGLRRQPARDLNPNLLRQRPNRQNRNK